MKSVGATSSRFLLAFVLLLSLANQVWLSQYSQSPNVFGQSTQHYTIGNQTYVSNPLLPTHVEKGRIPIGANWTYTATLNKGLKYHVYFIGNWITEVVTSRTDYDIYVIDPAGNCESNHTEAAGMPERLGDSSEDPLYVPKQTGNYSYIIQNDPKDSAGARNGTFMIIEHLDTNIWYENKLYLQGREFPNPIHPTAWTYEFNSSSSNIEISVDVPKDLDMYEVRLYLMSNPSLGKGSLLSGMPIPWEQGLYGRTYNDTKTKHIIGGYNLNSTGYRGNIWTSCGDFDEDMLINYTSPYKGSPLLYHLVFIAEKGHGNLSFMVKTDFSKPVFKLQPLGSTVEAGQDTTVQAVVNESHVSIDYLTLEYRINDNQTWSSTQMAVQASRTYSGKIPSQPAGTVVNYRVTAYDKARNKASLQSSYKSLGRSVLSVSTSASSINGGENITLSGLLNPSLQGAVLSVNYSRLQGSKVTRNVEMNSSGGFRDDFSPDAAGVWTISVGWQGNTYYTSVTKNVSFTVRKVSVSATLDVSKSEITLGDSVGLSGVTTPVLKNTNLKIVFTDPRNANVTLQASTGQDGAFTASYTPILSGQFTVRAIYDGSPFNEAFVGRTVSIKVNPKPSPSFLETYYMYFIAGGAAVVVVFFWWFRGRRKSEKRAFSPQLRKLPTK